MKNLIFLLCLVSVIAFGQKTDGELNTQNNNTIFTATLTPTRVGNMFEQSILSKVNKRTPVFLDSADITKRIKWFINGSHPTATTYNVTLPNKSGTVAFLDDILGDTTAFWKTTGISYMKNDTVRIATNEVDGITYFDAVEIEMNRGTGIFDSKIQINYFDGSVKTTLARFKEKIAYIGDPDAGNFLSIDPEGTSGHLLANGSTQINVFDNRIVLDPTDSVVFNSIARNSSGDNLISAPSNTLIDKNYLINIGKTFNALQTFNNTISPNRGDINIGSRASDPSLPVGGDIWRNGNDLKFRKGSNTRTFAFVEEIGGGGISKAGNGIILAAADSVVADTVKMAQKSDLSGWLTGTLTGNAQVNLTNSHTFLLRNGSTGGGSLIVSGNTTSGYTELRSYLGTGESVYVETSKPNARARIYYQLTGNIRGFTASSSSMFFTDDVTTKGVVYSADYSSNGVSDPRWIPDWNAVNNIAATLTNKTLTSPIINYGSDAAGDLYRRNAANTGQERLAKGAEGTILRAGASVPAYSTFTIPNTIAALSTFVANSANVLTTVTPAAGQSIRVNAGGTAWEAYTPGGGSSVLSDITAATGSNTINSGANHQIWDWNSLTSGTGMSFRSSSTGAASNTLRVVSIEKSGANSNSAQTTTALNVSNTSTGTTSKNRALVLSASGGTANLAVEITSGNFNWTSNITNAQNIWTLNRASSNEGSIRIENTANTRRSVLEVLNNSSGSSAVGVINFRNSANNLGYIGIASSANTTTFGSAGALGLMTQQSTDLAFGTNNSVRQRILSTGEILYPASTYLNFGTTAGSGGYGFRDNSGSMQFKNSGGSFANIIGGSTGSTNNAVLLADGTGSVTVKSSDITYSSGTLSRTSGGLIVGADGLTFNAGSSGLSLNTDYDIVLNSDSAVFVSNTNFPSVISANGSYFGAKNVGSLSEMFVKAEDGSETNISGKLTPKLESSTSFTLDASHISKGTYTSNGSAVTVTVPSTLQTGSVLVIMQEGAGTVSLSAGANVNIAGKTSTTGANDFIWLWLYKKDGGTSYYVGR